MDFKGIKEYYCSECEGFHNKRTLNQVKEMRNAFSLKHPNKEIKIPLSKFEKHKESAYKLTDSELWKIQFNKSCKNYKIKTHKKSTGSNKQ